MIEAIVTAAALNFVTPDRAAEQQMEYRASQSELADVQHGHKRSLYRGIWFDGSKRAQRCREAISLRESHHNYKAKNPRSSAMGAYQFLDSRWRDGLVFMFIKESKRTQDGLISEARSLRSVPIQKWNRYWQDRAFYTAWRFGEGAKHWRPLPC